MNPIVAKFLDALNALECYHSFGWETEEGAKLEIQRLAGGSYMLATSDYDLMINFDSCEPCEDSNKVLIRCHKHMIGMLYVPEYFEA